MKVASMTDTAMSQGLNRGVHSVAGGDDAPAGADAMGAPPGVAGPGPRRPGRANPNDRGPSAIT